MKDLVYVEKTTPIPKCAELMLAKKISSLAVGTGDHVDGIFTKTDLTRYYATQLPHGHRRVNDYMTTNYIWVPDNENTLNVLEKMVENKISRIVVKRSDGSTKGIVTLGDFMKPINLGNHFDAKETSDGWQKTKKIPTKSELHPRSGVVFDKRIKLTDIMTLNLITVQRNDDLTTACKAILGNHVDGIGVIEKNGALCGVLSKTDITRAVASMN